MKINNLVIGIIIVVLGALLLADSIVGSMFSLSDVKGIVGVVLLVLAASYLKAAKE
jgi:hypothetical protein